MFFDLFFIEDVPPFFWKSIFGFHPSDFVRFVFLFVQTLKQTFVIDIRVRVQIDEDRNDFGLVQIRKPLIRPILDHIGGIRAAYAPVIDSDFEIGDLFIIDDRDLLRDLLSRILSKCHSV